MTNSIRIKIGVNGNTVALDALSIGLIKNAKVDPLLKDLTDEGIKLKNETYITLGNVLKVNGNDSENALKDFLFTNFKDHLDEIYLSGSNGKYNLVCIPLRLIGNIYTHYPIN